MDNPTLLLVIIIITLFGILQINSISTKTVEKYDPASVLDTSTSKLSHTPPSVKNVVPPSVDPLNSQFTTDLKGTNTTVIGAYDDGKTDNSAPPNLTTILTPELSKIVDNSKPKLTSSELLPKDKNDKWFEDIPPNVSLDQASQNEYAIILPMMAQSRRNISYDVRNTLPVAKFNISPWNNSSYDPPPLNGSLC